MKTKKLIEAAKICAASHSFEGCPRCAYSGEPSCSEKLIYDLADRLEELKKKNKARCIELTDEYADDGYCPNCGKFEFEAGTTTWDYKYCPMCGQKLRFEEEKNLKHELTLIMTVEATSIINYDDDADIEKEINMRESLVKQCLSDVDDLHIKTQRFVRDLSE